MIGHIEKALKWKYKRKMLVKYKINRIRIEIISKITRWLASIFELMLYIKLR